MSLPDSGKYMRFKAMPITNGNIIMSEFSGSPIDQLKQLMDNTYGSYNQLQKSLMADTRMGNSHFKIPGPDGREGFGGACFPKDVNAFISYAKSNGVDLSLLKETTAVNNEIRSQYELNEREKEQNVNYGQAKKELKDKNNGSSKQK